MVFLFTESSSSCLLVHSIDGKFFFCHEREKDCTKLPPK